MDIGNVPFSMTDWSEVTQVEHKGAAGTSQWRTIEEGNVRVRMVEYSPKFRSDHWCPRGHVLLVLDGVLVIELKDGRKFAMSPGTSFQVGDDESNPHLAYSDEGAHVFIVD